MQVTVKHSTENQQRDAMSVWIQSLTTSQFEVCLQESRLFDGPHQNIRVVRLFIFIYFLVRTDHACFVCSKISAMIVVKTSECNCLMELFFFFPYFRPGWRTRITRRHGTQKSPQRSCFLKTRNQLRRTTIHYARCVCKPILVFKPILSFMPTR